MNQNIGKRWVEELKSGRRKQIKGVLTSLRHVDSSEPEVVGHCCLGVLCELAYADGATDRWIAPGDSQYTYGKRRGSHSDSSLPISVMRWAGIKYARYKNPWNKDHDNVFIDGKDRGRYESMGPGDGTGFLANDNDGPNPSRDFHQISKIIERHMEEL